MIYTNSIEGYCNKPLSNDQIQSMKDTLHDRAKRKIIWLASYALISILAVVIVGALIACSESPSIHPNSNPLFAAILFSVLLIFTAFVGGFIFKEFLNPYMWVTIAIHEIDMASSPEFLDDVENPCFENLSSPMARTLVENIQKTGRNMLVFEKQLINQLTRI